MEQHTITSLKETFYKKLASIIKQKGHNCGFMTKEKYSNLIQNVKESKLKTSGKTPADYQRVKRYDVVAVKNCEKLIFPGGGGDTNMKFFVSIDEIFDILHETHLIIGHGGRNKMIKELQKNYKNISSETVMVYLNLCDICQKKQRVLKKNLVTKQTTNSMISKSQIEIIDMQSQPDGDYNFILVYLEHLTKFVQLRPLKSKNPQHVANVLLDIFCIFGAPCVLQTSSDPEFGKEIVNKICFMWDELKMVFGIATETVDQDLIKTNVNTWLETNQTFKWSEGLCFVQLMKNRTFTEEIKCSPHEAMFGTPIKVGLNSTTVLGESIVSQEELEKIVRNFGEEIAAKPDSLQHFVEVKVEHGDEYYDESCSVIDLDFDGIKQEANQDNYSNNNSNGNDVIRKRKIDVSKEVIKQKIKTT